MSARRCYVIAGGTMIHVAPHFSLCAPAYGSVGRRIYRGLKEQFRGQENVTIRLLPTVMGGAGEPSTEIKKVYKKAGINRLETNEDLEKLIDYLVLQPETKGIIMAAAVCDWQPKTLVQWRREEIKPRTREQAHPGRRRFGKQERRLVTRDGDLNLELVPADKIIGKIRETRKDIFLVGFKATTGMSEQEQYVTGLGLLKGASCNLVLANDVQEHRNMVITPEEAKYHVTKDRKAALRGLCEMIALRSQLHFTRSEVVPGEPIPWDSDHVPANLRKVVNHLIVRGAYKPFRGKTVGHFATRGPKPGIIYTSRRKTDFNKIHEEGLLRIDTVDDDRVIAYGAKPSVGGQSQRIIFDQHPDVDCIVHAHVPLRPEEERRGNPGWNQIPIRAQRPYECGSMECGQNTSDGLHAVHDTGCVGIKVVMLDEHGPNLCFSKKTHPDKVIKFIEENFDLERKTGGPVNL